VNDDEMPRGNGASVVASPRVERAVQLARLELSPSRADKARGRSALGLPEPAPAATAAYSPGWAALRASGKVGALVSAVLLGAGFAAGYWLGRAEPHAAAPNRSELAMPAEAVGDATLGEAEARARQMDAPQRGDTPRPADGAGSGEAAPARVSSAAEAKLPVEASSRSPGRAPKPLAVEPAHEASGPVHEPGTHGSRGADELALMRRIERALRNDQPALALALLAELEDRVPDSALEEERLAASVMAHCGLRDAGHERRAQDFLQTRPRSVYRTRVLAACGAAAGVPVVRNDRARPSDGKAGSGDQ
jgi:hypothetical protein